MFKGFVADMVDFFHAGRQSGGGRSAFASAHAGHQRPGKSVDLESLELSTPPTAEAVAAKYKAGRIAEMSEYHAGL